MEFENKVVLLTGASSGIGKSATLAFAAQGANVIAVDINASKGEEVIKEIMDSGGKATFIKTNVGDWEAMRALSLIHI